MWCVPALRVPLVHFLINHFREKGADMDMETLISAQPAALGTLQVSESGFSMHLTSFGLGLGLGS